MTQSIYDTLGVLPSGIKSVRLNGTELAEYLRSNCDSEADREREKHHMLRDELYGDGGCAYMDGVLDKVFQDKTVRELRKAWVPFSRFNNAIKRIVNETSKTYSEAASRKVDGEISSEKYEEVLEVTEFDTVMQHASRMFSLHRAILVGPRVRVKPNEERDIVVDVLTPAKFRVVLHPNDPSLVVGYLIRTKSSAVRRTEMTQEPAWHLWTDHERITLAANFEPIAGSYIEHGLKICPWVPIKRMSNRLGFWPGEEGEDLVAGHITIWLNNILQNKETKSATKQTMLSGDTSTAARLQAADSETPLVLPDGVAASTVDMSMDTEMFRDNSSFVSDSMANNYGMSSAYMKHQGVQSAEAREVMRMPLRELRLDVEPMYRRFEKKFVRVLARVLRSDLPEMAFDPDGWSIDFADPQTPLTPRERLAHYKDMRAAGFDNPISYVIRQNPDLNEEQAEAFVLNNIERIQWYWEQTRSLQEMGIGPGSPLPNMPGRATTEANALEDQAA